MLVVTAVDRPHRQFQEVKRVLRLVTIEGGARFQSIISRISELRLCFSKKGNGRESEKQKKAEWRKDRGGGGYPKACRLCRVVAGPHSILDATEMHVRRVRENSGDTGGGGARVADHDASAAHVGQLRRVGAVASRGLGDCAGWLLDEPPRDPLVQPVLPLVAVTLRPSTPRVVQPAAGSRGPFGSLLTQCRGDGKRLRVQLIQAQHWPAQVSRPRNRLATAQVRASPCCSPQGAGPGSAAGNRAVDRAEAGASKQQAQALHQPRVLFCSCVYDPASPVEVAAAGGNTRNCDQDATGSDTNRFRRGFKQCITKYYVDPDF